MIAVVIAIIFVAIAVIWGMTVGRVPLIWLTDTFAGLPRMLPAGLAAVAGLAALLAVVWLGWTMTAIAQRLYGASDAIDGRTLYKLVLDLHAEIAVLKAEVKALQVDRALTAPVQTEQAFAVLPRASASRPAGPGDLPPDLREFSRQETPSERAVRTNATRLEESSFAPLPRSDAPALNSEIQTIIDDCASRPKMDRLIADYRRLLNGSGSMSEFELTYEPEYIALGQGNGLRGTLGDEEGPFWYILLDEHVALGLLLPAKGPIIKWGEMYQFGGGSHAQQVFGRAFRVEEGDELDLVEPAWARLDKQTVTVERYGVLRGA